MMMTMTMTMMMTMMMMMMMMMMMTTTTTTWPSAALPHHRERVSLFFWPLPKVQSCW
jgi:hypothetical protein